MVVWVLLFLVHREPDAPATDADVVLDAVSSTLQLGLRMVEEVLPPATENARVEHGLERTTHHRRVVFHVLKTLLNNGKIVVRENDVTLDEVPLTVQAVRT